MQWKAYLVLILGRKNTGMENIQENCLIFPGFMKIVQMNMLSVSWSCSDIVISKLIKFEVSSLWGWQQHWVKHWDVQMNPNINNNHWALLLFCFCFPSYHFGLDRIIGSFFNLGLWENNPLRKIWLWWKCLEPALSPHQK